MIQSITVNSLLSDDHPWYRKKWSLQGGVHLRENVLETVFDRETKRLFSTQ